MIKNVIASVPARIWEENRPPRLKVWEVELNVASWIRVSGASGDLALVLVYEDEAGEHTSMVDRTAVDGDGSALMSGLVRTRITGDVARMHVVLQLSDEGMRFNVDELFVQRRGSAVQKEHKLISNY
ncbi:MAG: hypothetical protein KBT87_08935 [Gammaproteobacteria bacterium]|jgi:hypothetical protein|nr:hypothetical protein [Gammaproteobacteria bacterium]MBQ0774783.1 hypothetical protein [Gammaproteobacteria bacterium]|tara:strand:- start:38571 stop:38951 length:381 start_codon:yes stop_codon:yes gene_type:complete